MLPAYPLPPAVSQRPASRRCTECAHALYLNTFLGHRALLGFHGDHCRLVSQAVTCLVVCRGRGMERRLASRGWRWTSPGSRQRGADRKSLVRWAVTQAPWLCWDSIRGLHGVPQGQTQVLDTRLAELVESGLRQWLRQV